MVATLLPSTTKASVLDSIFGALQPIKGTVVAQNSTSGGSNVQTMTLLRSATSWDPTPAVGGGNVTIVDKSALVPEEGPSGTIADIEKPKNATISLYVVRNGDTISAIAKMFDVSPNTILWANDLSKGQALTTGQTLTILPVTGIKYTVQKGDTLASIAKHFNADPTEIGNFNGTDDQGLNAGDIIIIPDAEASITSSSSSDSSNTTTTTKTHKTTTTIITTTTHLVHKTSGIGPEPAHDVGPEGTESQIAYYIAPLNHYIETQGIHGYNAVDLAAPIGTPILAAADGDVVVAKQGGWNGGYGSYVVIQHGNGSQTLYGHASKVVVSDGQHVVQGQIIAYVGVTGETTGPHVHFEIRNGIRNPF